MNSEILDRLPPQDLDAEKSMLGAVLLKADVLDEVLAICRPEDCYAEANRRIFAQMAAMHEARVPVDALTLRDRLKRCGDLEAIGGTAYLAEVAGSVPVFSHAAYHARIVRQKARYRSLILAATETLRDAYAESGEPDAIADKMEAMLLASDGPSDDAPVDAQESVVAALERIDRVFQDGRPSGLPIDFADFNRDIGGLFPGELFIVAARPGVGKTSMAAQIAYHVATHAGLVYVASMEMSHVEWTTRVLCSQAGVDSTLIRTGTLTDEHVRDLNTTANAMAQARWTVHDKKSRTVADVARWARRLVRRGLKLVVVDYLTLLQPRDRKIQRYQQVGEMAEGLKHLASELQVPVLCLAQLNRQGSDHEEPDLRMLRESGDIEQHADVVSFLWTPAAAAIEKRNDADRDKGREPGDWDAMWSIKKNRNGQVKNFRLKWHPSQTRFTPPVMERFSEFAGYETNEDDDPRAWRA